MTAYNLIVRGFDGASIPTIVTRPANARRWIIMIHGLTTSKSEYLGFYDVVAQRLAQTGIASIRFDCRGHGDSEASAQEFNITNNVLDALACLDFVSNAAPELPVDIFGTSFGAPTALFAAFLDSRLQHIYLLAPVLDFWKLYLDPEPNRALIYGNFLHRTLRKRQRIELNERVSFGAQNAIEFALFDLGKILRECQSRTTVMHGDADDMVPLSVTQAALAVAPAAKLQIFANMGHGYAASDDDSGESPESKKNLERITQTLSAG